MDRKSFLGSIGAFIAIAANAKEIASMNSGVTQDKIGDSHPPYIKNSNTQDVRAGDLLAKDDNSVWFCTGPSLRPIIAGQSDIPMCDINKHKFALIRRDVGESNKKFHHYE